MNRLSKAFQVRDKVTEPKPEKARAFNSTLSAGKGLSPVGKRGRKLQRLDGLCADEVMSRDGYACQSCQWLDGRKVDAHAVHHIARKQTHRGVDLRFNVGHQVALCFDCHGDEHAQNGMSRKLTITVTPEAEGSDRVIQRFERGGKWAERTVTDFNPFAALDE
jgi:hypothetical protein